MPSEGPREGKDKAFNQGLLEHLHWQLEVDISLDFLVATNSSVDHGRHD